MRNSLRIGRPQPENDQGSKASLCRSSVVRRVYDAVMKPIGDYLRPLSVLVLALFMLQGCNTLNPFCGSARPSPTIRSLSPSTVTFTEVQQGFLLTVNGSHFVSSSVVVANGTTLSTLATSSQQLQATITTAVISAPGTASVKVNTPSGNSSDLGCTSGGTSKALVLTIT
jgi:hypothetical protein